MKNLRFAYLSADNPKDKKIWSGTHYSIYNCLLSLGEVEILGPAKPKSRWFIGQMVNQFCLKLFKKRFNYRHSKLISKGYADHFNAELKGKNFDLIIAPAASCELAYVDTKIPIVYITDGTFAGCLNYHKTLSNLTQSSINEGNFVEREAIAKSTRVIVSSDWAATSAVKDYGCDKTKVATIPYGANFEKIPTASELNYTIPQVWKLLFVGVYWDTKGGEYAYNCFKILLDKGFNVELTVLGCDPPETFKHPKMTVIFFIDKNSAEGANRLFDIFKEHHFLILPTRFDCTPIVINEASAFGIPSLVANTGGVQGHLKNGVNGYLVDYNDTGNGYANIVEKIITTPEKYIELRKSTRTLYDEKLNWNNWKAEFEKIISSIT